MTLKVSVVVAVYNTGPNLLQLIHSLDVQSLPSSDFEILLVDDGSTDDTPALLREVAATRPHVQVHTIENSGWPGRPRNVGLAHAGGDYVFFSDHDDELFPFALERMHDTAQANDSDIVYGKVVRSGRPTPYWALAQGDVAHADLVEHRLMESRSTHKLYRRQFLVDHDIRFLEGRVRLEDHHFMGQALAAGPRVSVLASVPCYRWVHRNDGSNSSSGRVDLDWYFDFFRRSIELLQDPSLPQDVQVEAGAVGAERMFMAVPPRRWATLPVDERRAAVSTLATFVDACVPVAAERRLGVIKRAAVMALRANDVETFDAVQQLRLLIDASPSLRQTSRDGDRLRLAAEVDLLQGLEEDLTVEDVDGAPTLVPRSATAERALPPELRTLPGWDAVGSLELTVRRTGTGLEWPVPQRRTLPSGSGAGAQGVTAGADATIDPEAGPFGEPLGPGAWNVMGRAEVLGESRTRRVSAGGVDRQSDAEPDPQLERDPQPAAAPALSVTATDGGHLRVTVGKRWRRPQAHDVGWDGDRLVLRLEPAPREAVVVARLRDGDGDPQPCSRARLDAGTATVALPPTTAGRIVDLSVVTPSGSEWRVGYEGPDVTGRPALRVYATANGSLSVKHEVTSARPAREGWVRSVGRAFRRRG